MDRIIDVLVVDNDSDFATECVDFLQLVCNVGAEKALTATEAEKKLKEYPIKIVLLDYDMPVNGLDLFPRLKSIDDTVEIVFISAVASNDVLYKAEKFPFAAKISKATCFNELPELIPTLLMRYARETNKFKSDKPFYIETKGGMFEKHRVEYFMCSYQIVDQEYIFKDSWHTTQMIQAGEKLQHTEVLDYEKLFNFQDNFKLNADYNFELSNEQLIKLKTSLATQLESQIKSEYTKNIKVAINRMRELSLSEKENTSDSSIVARYYDFANVYFEIKIRIKRHCSCCNSDTILLTTAYFPIPKVAYRIREYFDGKEPKVIRSGFYETGFSPARFV